MTRLLSLVVIALGGAAAVGLYQLSYDVQRLEDELAEINRAVTQDRENILVLEAEWSYLTRPELVQARAVRNLDLRPTMPSQIVTADRIPTLQERVKVDPPGAKPGPKTKTPVPMALPAPRAVPVTPVAELR